MTNDDKIRKMIQSAKDESFAHLDAFLRNRTHDMPNTLASIAASLCHMSVEDMFTGTKVKNAQARWLFWHELRYVMGETYEEIATKYNINGRVFSVRNVGEGIKRIGKLIATNNTWKHKFALIRHSSNIIKHECEAMADEAEGRNNEQKITIKVQKGMTKHIEIKEV